MILLLFIYLFFLLSCVANLNLNSHKNIRVVNEEWGEGGNPSMFGICLFHLLSFGSIRWGGLRISPSSSSLSLSFFLFLSPVFHSFNRKMDRKNILH